MLWDLRPRTKKKDVRGYFFGQKWSNLYLGMTERIYPESAIGFAKRLLAYDEYQGRDSRVAKTAYELYQKRVADHAPGSSQEDWKKAEEIVMEDFAREVVKKAACERPRRLI